MQDRYAGDIGDFGKFGLLKALCNQGLALGVNWYLTNTGKFEESIADGKYEITESCSTCDNDLADKLRKVFNAKYYPERSVKSLEEANLLSGAKYYSRVIELPSAPSFSRARWHIDAMDALAGCDVVFLDPDNGKKAKSVGTKSQKSVKYVFDNELADYMNNGQSVVFYNHRPRIAEDAYFCEFGEYFKNSFPGSQWYAITFRKGTLRDYFIITQEKHQKAIESAIDEIMTTKWNTVFTRVTL